MSTDTGQGVLFSAEAAERVAHITRRMEAFPQNPAPDRQRRPANAEPTVYFARVTGPVNADGITYPARVTRLDPAAQPYVYEDFGVVNLVPFNGEPLINDGRYPVKPAGTSPDKTTPLYQVVAPSQTATVRTTSVLVNASGFFPCVIEAWSDGPPVRWTDTAAAGWLFPPNLENLLPQSYPALLVGTHSDGLPVFTAPGTPVEVRVLATSLTDGLYTAVPQYLADGSPPAWTDFPSTNCYVLPSNPADVLQVKRYPAIRVGLHNGTPKIPVYAVSSTRPCGAYYELAADLAPFSSSSFHTLAFDRAFDTEGMANATGAANFTPPLAVSRWWNVDVYVQWFGNFKANAVTDLILQPVNLLAAGGGHVNMTMTTAPVARDGANTSQLMSGAIDVSLGGGTFSVRVAFVGGGTLTVKGGSFVRIRPLPQV